MVQGMFAIFHGIEPTNKEVWISVCVSFGTQDNV